MGPVHLRGLALTCAVLLVVGLIGLARVDEETAAAPQGRGRLVAAGEAPVASGEPAPDVPELIPLFPATTTTLIGRSTSTTTAAVAVGASSDAVTGPPAAGAYAYSVSGQESLNGSTRRLPAALNVSVQRSGARDAVLDLRFSDQHTERELISFGDTAVAVRQASSTIRLGLTTRMAAAVHTPPVALIALPLSSGATRRGITEVKDNGGQFLRTEEWKVTDVGPRRLDIAGTSVRAWEVTLERTSRPGAVEQLRETRRVWFDPARRLWVRWELDLHTRRASNGLSTTYDLTYTATLSA